MVSNDIRNKGLFEWDNKTLKIEILLNQALLLSRKDLFIEGKGLFIDFNVLLPNCV
jgi:hypothetical protein